MSTTDELRKWGYGFCGDTYDFVTAIADRIDAEHEAMLADARKAVYQDYVALPKDADGEYIHIGDVMENTVCPSVHREVTAVGVECFYGWNKGNGRYSQFSANCYRHHHAPTVESVLREFGDWYAHTKGGCDEDGIIAEYAAKLRLAGDAS